jgi:opacity protein-like surface antigen
MKKFAIIAATAAVAFASAASAAPVHKHTVVATQPKERLGTLSCTVAGGVGMILGSNKAVDCEFKRRNGAAEHYVGSIGKLGIDIGVTRKAYLSWIVYNVQPTRAGQGALAGSYVGASAGASVGYGLGANALVGGTAKNFGLQPLSGETSTGLNVAAGVAQLQLNLAK